MFQFLSVGEQNRMIFNLEPFAVIKDRGAGKCFPKFHNGSTGLAD
jgi:hypothetical protein